MAKHDPQGHDQRWGTDVCTVWCPAHPNHWQTQPKTAPDHTPERGGLTAEEREASEMTSWELLQQIQAFGRSKYDEGYRHGLAAASRALGVNQ